MFPVPLRLPVRHSFGDGGCAYSQDIAAHGLGVVLAKMQTSRNCIKRQLTIKYIRCSIRLMNCRSRQEWKGVNMSDEIMNVVQGHRKPAESKRYDRQECSEKFAVLFPCRTFLCQRFCHLRQLCIYFDFAWKTQTESHRVAPNQSDFIFRVFAHL